jgi:type I restriction enzyme S subunit
MPNGRNNQEDQPDRWMYGSLGNITLVNPESLGSSTPRNHEFQYIDISSVTTGRIDWTAVTTQNYGSAPSRARRIVRPSDVLLCMVRPSLQAHAYADWSDADGYVCSTGFSVLRCGEDLFSRYLFHCLFSDSLSRQVRELETGSNYPALSERDVKSLQIFMPPYTEQRHITEVLDSINEAIQSTEALIAKLKQMKAGLLHDLLTLGLDENGELRDPVAHPEQFKKSALGVVPALWSVRKLGRMCDLLNGLAFKPTDWSDFGLPILRIQNLNGGSEFNYYDKPVPDEYLIYPGTLLFSWSGNRGTSFGPFLWYGPTGILNQHIFKVTPMDDVRIGWFYYALDAVRQTAERAAHGGSGLVHVRRADLINYLIATPDEKEQERIENTILAHDQRTLSEEIYLSSLNQLEKGLMKDLLTGRVRVPSAAEVLT